MIACVCSCNDHRTDTKTNTKKGHYMAKVIEGDTTREVQRAYRQNVDSFIAWIDGELWPRLFFYTTREVKQNAELLLDYGKDYWKRSWDQKELDFGKDWKRSWDHKELLRVNSVTPSEMTVDELQRVGSVLWDPRKIMDPAALESYTSQVVAAQQVAGRDENLGGGASSAVAMETEDSEPAKQASFEAEESVEPTAADTATPSAALAHQRSLLLDQPRLFHGGGGAAVMAVAQPSDGVSAPLAGDEQAFKEDEPGGEDEVCIDLSAMSGDDENPELAVEPTQELASSGESLQRAAEKVAPPAPAASRAAFPPAGSSPSLSADRTVTSKPIPPAVSVGAMTIGAPSNVADLPAGCVFIHEVKILDYKRMDFMLKGDDCSFKVMISSG